MSRRFLIDLRTLFVISITATTPQVRFVLKHMAKSGQKKRRSDGGNKHVADVESFALAFAP